MKTSLIFYLFVLCITILGCAVGPHEIEAMTPSVSRPQMEMTDLISTGIASSTPEGIKTQMPFSSASPTQALFMIENLLSQNDYCISPCVWGIVAGKTTLTEAQSIFDYLGEPLTPTLQTGDQSYFESAFGPRHGLEGGTSFQVILRVQDERVTSIAGYLTPPHDGNISANEKWKAYTLQYVLERYGIPSDIHFAYPVSPGLDRPEIINYFTTLYFDSFDLIFQYEFSIKYESGAKKEGYFSVCPTVDKVLGVRIWLGEKPINAPEAGFPLEKISSLTRQDFYDDLTENNACIDLNQKILFPWK